MSEAKVALSVSLENRVGCTDAARENVATNQAINIVVITMPAPRRVRIRLAFVIASSGPYL
jgi:hypothetical protein